MVYFDINAHVGYVDMGYMYIYIQICIYFFELKKRAFWALISSHDPSQIGSPEVEWSCRTIGPRWWPIGGSL